MRWIVPYPAGGGSDFLARTVGAQMEKQLGQPLVIENRPGAADDDWARRSGGIAVESRMTITPSSDNGTFV